MYRRVLTAVFASFFLLLAGCRGAAPVYNITSTPVVTNKPATIDDVQKAISRAGVTLGWHMAPLEPGRMEGVLVLRTHRAVVDIAYDMRMYSIQYKDSSNLNYDPDGKTIHANYNGWIQNLDKAIRAQLSLL
jgi:hypothetical protein